MTTQTPIDYEGIEEALARFQELDDQFDRALDDDSVSKAEMLRVKDEWNLAWGTYSDACRDAGICVRPGCRNSVVVANQRICPTCREEER